MGINRSGYYKWKSRQGKLNRYEQDRILLTQLLHEEHELHPSLGYHRLARNIFHNTGWVFSDNLAHKCCKAAGIRSKARKCRYRPPGEESIKYENLVKGHWNAKAPLQIVVSYLCFLVTAGAGSLSYGGRTYDLEAGDCVFLDCQRPYQHHTGDDLWQLHWVHFYGPNMAAIYKKYQERGGLPCFRAADPGGYAALLDELYALAESDTYVRDMQIYEKLIALLTLLMEESWHPDTARAPGSKKQNLQEIKDYLDTHYTEKITLDALAERFYINKFYLTRVFKEQFGQSVTNYLVQLRITQSKRLLRFTDRSIEAVAQECGLNDANYFSRLFKKVEGTTPGEYRRQW